MTAPFLLVAVADPATRHAVVGELSRYASDYRSEATDGIDAALTRLRELKEQLRSVEQGYTAAPAVPAEAR